MGVMALSNEFLTKEVNDEEGNKKLIHSMASCEYFKLSDQYHLLFSFSGHNKFIIVTGAYKDSNAHTIYEHVFTIKIT